MMHCNLQLLLRGILITPNSYVEGNFNETVTRHKGDYRGRKNCTLHREKLTTEEEIRWEKQCIGDA